jgi:hypothetical protein
MHHSGSDSTDSECVEFLSSSALHSLVPLGHFSLPATPVDVAPAADTIEVVTAVTVNFIRRSFQPELQPPRLPLIADHA